MAVLEEDGLKKLIKDKKITDAFILYGDEGYLKKFYCEKMVSMLVSGPMEDFNLHRFEGDASIDEILLCCEALPMMSDKCCVVVHDLNFDSMNQKDFDAFSKALGDLPETTALIIWQDNLPFDMKLSARSAKVIKLFEKYGYAVQIKKRTGAALLKPLMTSAAKRGCNIDSAVASYLVSVVGDDYHTLINELDKLCYFVKSGDITRKVIDDICVKSIEATAFDLTKALIANNPEKANHCLNILYEKKVKTPLIMGALIGVYVDMYRAKVCLESGKQSDYFADVFSCYKGKEFKLRNAARDAAKISMPALRKSLDILSQADQTLKTEYTDAMLSRIVLEKSIIRLMLAAKEE